MLNGFQEFPFHTFPVEFCTMVGFLVVGSIRHVKLKLHELFLFHTHNNCTENESKIKDGGSIHPFKFYNEIVLVMSKNTISVFILLITQIRL